MLSSPPATGVREVGTRLVIGCRLSLFRYGDLA
jgi:hypothetical protein